MKKVSFRTIPWGLAGSRSTAGLSHRHRSVHSFRESYASTCSPGEHGMSSFSSRTLCHLDPTYWMNSSHISDSFCYLLLQSDHLKEITGSEPFHRFLFPRDDMASRLNDSQANVRLVSKSEDKLSVRERHRFLEMLFPSSNCA